MSDNNFSAKTKVVQRQRFTTEKRRRRREGGEEKSLSLGPESTREVPIAHFAVTRASSPCNSVPPVVDLLRRYARDDGQRQGRLASPSSLTLRRPRCYSNPMTSDGTSEHSGASTRRYRKVLLLRSRRFVARLQHVQPVDEPRPQTDRREDSPMVSVHQRHRLPPRLVPSLAALLCASA